MRFRQQSPTTRHRREDYLRKPVATPIMVRRRDHPGVKVVQPDQRPRRRYDCVGDPTRCAVAVSGRQTESGHRVHGVDPHTSGDDLGAGIDTRQGSLHEMPSAKNPHDDDGPMIDLGAGYARQHPPRCAQQYCAPETTDDFDVSERHRLTLQRGPHSTPDELEAAIRPDHRAIPCCTAPLTRMRSQLRGVRVRGKFRPSCDKA